MSEKPTYEDAILRAAVCDWVMDALTGKEVCDFADSFCEVSLATEFRQANDALIEVERRIRKFSPKFVKFLEDAKAPQEIREAYKWAIYGSAIHAQLFIVRDVLPMPESTDF